eukprot:2341745-Pleurochrysis_carterae.AAC.1
MRAINTHAQKGAHMNGMMLGRRTDTHTCAWGPEATANRRQNLRVGSRGHSHIDDRTARMTACARAQTAPEHESRGKRRVGTI